MDFRPAKVTEQSLAMTQIDGIKRHVYLKFTDDQYVHDILQRTNGTIEYKHVTGELSVVRIEPAGIGIRRIKLMHLPPETPERTLRTALAPYGDVISIQDE
jgi:beta-galactosidase/beta-glucuronidase